MVGYCCQDIYITVFTKSVTILSLLLISALSSLCSKQIYIAYSGTQNMKILKIITIYAKNKEEGVIKSYDTFFFVLFF